MGGVNSSRQLDGDASNEPQDVAESVEQSPENSAVNCDLFCHDEEDEEGESSWWDCFQWCAASKKFHRHLEEMMIEGIQKPYRFHAVNIGPVVGQEDSKIWTLSVNETCENVPLVLLHGFGSGLALWALNLNDLSSDRPVHAIDVLGFGGSSRPTFSTTPEEVENEFVSSIEAWRREMKLEGIVLCGHSFGGFLATVYSIRYPEVIEHCCLVDPWGFKECPTQTSQILNLSTPLIILLKIFVPFNLTPLWGLRVLGRIAPAVIEFFRQDLIQHFVPEVKDASKVLSHYIYQCNARTPTGEQAFNCLMASFGWAKNPLNSRIHALDENIPLTIICGARSWVDHASAEEVDQHRGSRGFVDMHFIEGCGHHVYTEDRPTFNKILLQACMNTKSNALTDLVVIQEDTDDDFYSTKDASSDEDESSASFDEDEVVSL